MLWPSARCAYCNKAFTPAKHGLQRYCYQAHRQRAYVRGFRAEQIPWLLEVLRRLDVVPQLRIVRAMRIIRAAPGI
jgi:hypothetical protein